MTRRVAQRYSAHHVLIFDEDWELLEAQFDRNYGLQRIGTGKAIRDLVHHWCNRVRARENEALSQQAEIGHRAGEEGDQNGAG